MDGGSENIHGRLDRKAHFEETRRQLLTSAQQRAHAMGTNPRVQATAHEDCLAISWSGDLEHRIAHAYNRERSARLKALRAAEQVSGGPPRRRRGPRDDPALAERCRARYDGKREADYAFEVYLFQKTSEVPPRAIETVAPGLLCELGAVPLHHYYLISREQPVVDLTETPVFTRWRLEPATFATFDDVRAALLGRMFPEACPAKTTKSHEPNWLSKLAAALLVLFLVLATAAAAAAVWVWRDGFAQDAAARQDPTTGARLAAIEGAVDQIAERYEDLEARLANLPAPSGRSADLQGLLTRLEAIEQRLDAETFQARGSTGALGSPPCAFTPRDTSGPAIGYLARVLLSDDGIRVFAWTGPEPTYGAENRRAALATLDFDPPEPMSAAAFAGWAAQARALSQQAGCRHYVVLNETGQGQARTYADLRAAVEDNFYIFRVAP